MIPLKITIRIPVKVQGLNSGNQVGKPFITRFFGGWIPTITESPICIKLIKNAMEQNFSWEESAKEYVKLYIRAIENKNSR
jgi:hypothetical protein